ALRGRRPQLGTVMAMPDGTVASREKSGRATERDRDRGAVVEHRVFAQPVDANGEAARRAGDRDHVVEAGVGGRGLDPLATYLKPVLTLEDREGRAGDVSERACAGLEEHAEAMVARLVAEDERDVDPAGTRIERDRDVHGTSNELGRASEAIAAKALWKTQIELDDDRRAGADDRPPPAAGRTHPRDGGARVGIGALRATRA